MKLRLVRASTLAMSPSSIANAAVLTVDNQPSLCVASYDGVRAVDKDALALAVATEAGAGPYLDGSNAGGVRDGAIQLKTAGSIPSEPAYALLNAGLKEREDNKPFGPNVDLRRDKRALQIRDAIARVLEREIAFLIDPGFFPVGPGTKPIYHAKRRDEVTGAPTTDDGWKKLELLFYPDPPLVIICDSGGSPKPASPLQETKPLTEQFVDVIRLRGTVKDLTIKADKLADAKPASISFQRNEEADTETFGLNGVLAVRFGDSAGVFDAMPFISYENTSVTGKKGDVDKISPGLLLGYKVERPEFAVHARVELSYMDDIEQDARQAKIRAYVDPAFALGEGRGVLFGSELAPLGPVRFRPDLTIIVDGSHVYDAGTSSELAGAEDYLGLGGEASLRTRLDLGQPISDFVLQLGVRRLQLFGDIHDNDATRWFANLAYSPQNFPYVGFRFAFSKGDNDDTFQDEEKYALELTLRY
jgi:hypothetical protein